MKMNDFKMRHSASTRCIAAGAVALLCSASLLAQDKQLILQTTPDPTVIDLTGSLQFDANGDIVVTPTDPTACTATGTCEDVTVQIDSFTANNEPTSVSVGQGTGLTFRWTTRGAYACDGTGLNGWTSVGKLPSNTGGEIVPTSSLNPGNYTAGLSCYNGSVIADPSEFIDIEIVEDSDPPPVGCEGRTLPSDWSRMTNGSNNCSYKFGVTGNGLDPNDDCRWFGKTSTHGGVYPWPWDQQTSFQKVVGVPSSNNGKHYIALEFNSGNTLATEDRFMNVNLPQTSNLQNTQKLLSISRCPGDFNRQEINAEMGPGCVYQTFTNNFAWGGSNFENDPTTCALEPNTRYYFNIIFSDSSPGTAPENIQPNCTNLAGCGSRFTPSGG